MMPDQPAATPAPLHDIAGPVAFFPYPLWMVIAAGAGALLMFALLIWFMRRNKPKRVLTPKERALAALAELRKSAPETNSYAFGVRVSDALRTYIRDQFGLDAVTRTSVEFLEELRENVAFTDNEKGALSEFLEAVDLLKYARVEAGETETIALFDLAERLVKGEQAREAAK